MVIIPKRKNYLGASYHGRPYFVYGGRMAGSWRRNALRLYNGAGIMMRCRISLLHLFVKYW